ncbi:hypothetical protein [Streptomyces sp. PD-S100-1]|uniref:hypothetical protein n=1 Tax=Streptomyces sp. PD-S100-1 TaxID=3394351 RepID=UPI0039BC49D0
MTGTTALTLGGLLAALLVLIANLHPWWKGGREVKQLSAFGKGFTAAAMAAACPGGLLGWAHSHVGAAANGAGERASAVGSGTTSGSAITRGQLIGLSSTGAVVAVAVVFLVVLEYRGAGKKDKRRIIGGVFVGSTLLLTAGVAGLLKWLPGALNAFAGVVVDAVQGAGLL